MFRNAILMEAYIFTAYTCHAINMKYLWLKCRRFMIMTVCIHDIVNVESYELMWKQDKT